MAPINMGLDCVQASPMSYKEKTCPKCGTIHKKRGPYCSRSCGNQRTHSESHKANVAEAKREWHQTSDIAQVVAHNFISQGLHKTPDPIDPPTPTLEHNQFVSDGDLWTEV